MKITDYALVFVGISLPFILIAYINIALTIRTFQQEMYYQKVIDAAVEDTMNQMKFVESKEVTNDYGYSGMVDNKLSNNPQIAVDTFLKSIYGSMDILDDKPLQSIFNLYVPVIAIMDYNGVYISSVVEDENGNYIHEIKPKRYFSFEYAVDGNKEIFVASSKGWHRLIYNEENNTFKLDEKALFKNKKDMVVLHNIEFTTDDRIFDTVTENIINDVNKKTKTYDYYMTHYDYDPNFDNLVDVKDYSNDTFSVSRSYITKGLAPIFYGLLSDGSNNNVLIEENLDKMQAFTDFLKKYKKEMITEIVIQELSYAANKNNEFARKKGISYNFAFSLDKNDTMYNDIENMGVLALVQGIKVGNRYLNYKAYNYSDLELTHKYFLTVGEKQDEDSISVDGTTKRFGEKLKLYHKTKDCIEYINDEKNIEQEYTYTKEAAALMGYYPCPICSP